MELLTQRARAYVYSGKWVADCPRACGNVELLFDPRTGARKPSFYCSYCQQVAEIEWSIQEAEIMEVLERRPIPHTRNWYPKGHTTAIKFRIPDGQSIRDLRDENAEHGVE